MLFRSEWNENENEYVEKYGEIPPPPSVIPPSSPQTPKLKSIPETPGVPSPGIDHGIIKAPNKESYYKKPGAPIYNPAKPVVRVQPIKGNNSDPLYVIDGVEQPRNSPVIDKINPEDIESVNILKGEVAEKTYGDKGKNGVVIISTRKNNSRHLLNENSLKNFEGLIVVDGEEIDRQKLDERLKSDDIESMDVLKAEPAKKIYGDKGKNGVIVITTKKKFTRSE